MIPARLQIKFFLENTRGVDMPTFTTVFQRWIQGQVLEGLLIDVADYRHVFQGPGIVLIGHESDYAIENHAGRLGLLYTRKRQPEADLQAHLRSAFRLALAACERLETEIDFLPMLQFRANEIEIRFADRLQFPNRAETFDAVKDDVRAVLANLYGSDTFQVAPASQDPRHLFTLSVRSPVRTDIIATLAERLRTSVRQAAG